MFSRGMPGTDAAADRQDDAFAAAAFQHVERRFAHFVGRAAHGDLRAG